MSRFLIASFIMMTVLLAACTPKAIRNTDPVILTASDAKAHCVIINCDGNFDEFVPIYIDNRVQGGLKDKSITTIDVDPGVHYIIAELDNIAIKKLNFVAGKVFFFKLGTLEVPMFDGVRMDLLTKEEAEFQIKLNSELLIHTRLNPEYDFQDFDPREYAEELSEYVQWAKENPADTLAYFNYKGY